MILDLHTVIRNNTEIVCTLCLVLMVMSYKTIAQYHNEDVDIDAIKIQNDPITRAIIPVAIF